MPIELPSMKKKKLIYWDVIFFAAAGAIFVAVITTALVTIREQNRQIQTLEQQLSDARKEIEVLKKTQ